MISISLYSKGNCEQRTDAGERYRMQTNGFCANECSLLKINSVEFVYQCGNECNGSPDCRGYNLWLKPDGTFDCHLIRYLPALNYSNYVALNPGCFFFFRV